MNPTFVETFIGVHTADAERIKLFYLQGNLILEYTDWKEQPCKVELQDALAFRWQEYDDTETPRDDTTYRVVNSIWLKQQIPDETEREQYAHYKLCFNACGVLDLLCREISNHG